jgi:hypothetical protein
MFRGMSEQQPRSVAAPHPARDPEASLRRAAAALEKGGLKEAAAWTRLAADAIAEKKRGH